MRASLRAGPQLLTYPDSLGGRIADIAALLAGPLDGLFTGVHVLPPFPSSGDRGFAPTTYFEIDARFGSWSDIRALAERYDVVLDLMINHISRRSAEFEDFARHGRASPYADLFITLDKVWPDGRPPAEDVARIFLRKPQAPFSTVRVADTGAEERIWTSFGTRDWSEQVDIDVTSPATRDLIASWLRFFAEHGVGIVRLDAAGYVIKRPGTSCFMVEPEIWEFLGWVASVADGLGLVALPEIHDRPATHAKLAAHGHWTYDFVLPGLLLHALATGTSERLAAHLAGSPANQFTMLDCHDGIPVRPDLEGVLTPDEMRALADLVVDRGGNVNRILSDSHADDGVDVHQLNATYYSALGGDDERYLLARAIQLFARGVPQVYYVGLLAGENDLEAVARTGDGRAVNRHDYGAAEIAAALERPIVRRTLDLLRLRRDHPAFAGSLDVTSDGPSLRMTWRSGDASCELRANLASGAAEISASDPSGVRGERAAQDRRSGGDRTEPKTRAV